MKTVDLEMFVTKEVVFLQGSYNSALAQVKPLQSVIQEGQNQEFGDVVVGGAVLRPFKGTAETFIFLILSNQKRTELQNIKSLVWETKYELL